MNQAALHILLSLSQGPLHGYGIIKEIEALSGGQFRVGPGTLYDNLPRLIAQGLVADLDANDARKDPRRRYELTQSGAKALAAEIERLGNVLRVGRQRLQRLTLAEEKQR